MIRALVAAALAGCAANADDSAAASDDSALSSGAGVEFTSAVGAVLVDGKKVCTAALVDIDASAKIGPVSASGRQIVFGGACVGKLQNGVGAAVFVSMQNGVSISTPIIGFDFESQASAGLAVGILGKAVPGAEPIDVVGVHQLDAPDGGGLTVAGADDATQGRALVLGRAVACGERHTVGAEVGNGAKPCLGVAKPRFGVAPRLLRRHSPLDVLLGAHVDVEPQLLVDLVVNRVARPERTDAIS